MTPDEETPVEPTEGAETPAAEAKAAKKPVRKKAAKATEAKETTAETTAEASEGEQAPTKKAAKKAAAKDAASAQDGDDEGKPAGEQKVTAEKKRTAKKATRAKAAAPGDAGEAQEVAEVQEAAKPSKKLARSASSAVKGPPRRKVVAAHARYVRTSARKARMVCGHIRGKSVQEARAILAFTPREVARDWSKLLESAVANAESNHELLEDDLIVREAFADEGPTIKRFRPRAMGRATPIRKRTSHLTITLTPAPEPGTSKRNS
jgi:ribosomal protein L22